MASVVEALFWKPGATESDLEAPAHVSVIEWRAGLSHEDQPVDIPAARCLELLRDLSGRILGSDAAGGVRVREG